MHSSSATHSACSSSTAHLRNILLRVLHSFWIAFRSLSFLSVVICRTKFRSFPSHLTPEASSPGPCTLQEWIHHSAPRSTQVCCHLPLSLGFWKTQILSKCQIFFDSWQMHTIAYTIYICIQIRHCIAWPITSTYLFSAISGHWSEQSLSHTGTLCAIPRTRQHKQFRRTLLLVRIFCWWWWWWCLTVCLCTPLLQIASLTSFRIDRGCCGRCRGRSLVPVATRISYAYRQIYICMKCPAHDSSWLRSLHSEDTSNKHSHQEVWWPQFLQGASTLHTSELLPALWIVGHQQMLQSFKSSFLST